MKSNSLNSLHLIETVFLNYCLSVHVFTKKNTLAEHLYNSRIHCSYLQMFSSAFAADFHHPYSVLLVDKLTI